MLVAFFLVAPLFVVIETIDILRMRSITTATIRHAAAAYGNEGSRPDVAYCFTVNGVNYDSSQYAPGWMANRGSWTDGGRGVTARYKPGQLAIIHYRLAHPTDCCLEYGWFKWSIGFSLGVWGLIIGKSEKRETWPRRAIGRAMALSGIVLIFFAPNIIPVAQIHLYLAAFFGILACAAVYSMQEQSKTQPTIATAMESKAEKQVG